MKGRTILSDNGREFRGCEDLRPYELFLQLEEIEHQTTQAGRPQSNGLSGASTARPWTNTSG